MAFIHLSGSAEDISGRLSARLDHFMPVSLLESQLNTLEPLAPDENGIVIQLGRRPKDEAEEIMKRLELSELAPPPVNSGGLFES